MQLKSGILAIVLAALCLFWGQQTRAQTAAPTPVPCNESQSMQFDANKVAGIWWEVARHPGPPTPFACAKINLTVMPDNVLHIATTFSDTPAYLWVNSTMTANVTLPDAEDSADGSDPSNGPLAINHCGATNGCNISYMLGHFTLAPTVFKLLDTDYQNYALVCGYSNATDNATFYGVVLTRDRTPNVTVLDSYEATASTKYADFPNGTMSLIAQTPMCYASDAMANMPGIFPTFVFFLLACTLGV